MTRKCIWWAKPIWAFLKLLPPQPCPDPGRSRGDPAEPGVGRNPDGFCQPLRYSNATSTFDTDFLFFFPLYL